MKNLFYIILSSLIFISSNCFAQRRDSVSTDSLTIVKEEAQAKKNIQQIVVFKPNPNKAMLLSAIVPGAGQIYNNSYWKAPLIWGGAIALVYAISWNSNKYNEYRKAYMSIADADTTTNYYQKYIPVGETEVNTIWLKQALNAKQLSFRRSRDLSIIGAIGLYSLNILDAFVDAQLYDFDISPDLTLHIEPYLTNNYSSINSMIGLHCQLTF